MSRPCCETWDSVNKARRIYATEMVLDCSSGNYCDSAFYLHRRRSGDASVELAPAAAVRMVHADLLASPRPAGTMPCSLWRAGRPRPGPGAPPTLQKDHSRREGEVPPRHGGGL